MKLVPVAVSRAFGRQGLMLQKNSPNLLFGVGVVGVIGGTVLACRATLKMQDVLDEAQANLKKTRDAREITDKLQNGAYTDKDLQKDTTLIYIQTAVKIGRLYSPAVIVGGASIAALASSHSILTKRNASLTAAYAALDRGFREYRERVVEKYGEEQDREFRYSSEPVQVKDEKGKDKIVTRVGPSDPSIYARFFDQLSPSWSKEPEYNFIFLKAQQTYFNDLLHARGHVFLNEVYDSLGIPRSKAGSVVGWVLTGQVTDNYVDFGIFEDAESIRDFVNGREGSILLDFNVDGMIYDKIENHGEDLSWQLSK